MTETQINGIWIVETPPEPSPEPEPPSGHTCWKCGARSGKVWIMFGFSDSGWERDRWTCEHEATYACPEHGFDWQRKHNEYPSCPECGCQEEYT